MKTCGILFAFPSVSVLAALIPAHRGGEGGISPRVHKHQEKVWVTHCPCYSRSLPLRWIFKIFPSLCLAVAIPFFSRLAVGRDEAKWLAYATTTSFRINALLSHSCVNKLLMVLKLRLSDWPVQHKQTFKHELILITRWSYLCFGQNHLWRPSSSHVRLLLAGQMRCSEMTTMMKAASDWGRLRGPWVASRRGFCPFQCCTRGRPGWSQSLGWVLESCCPERVCEAPLQPRASFWYSFSSF